MCVRTSTAFYGRFILSMDRSPGFGSMYTDYSHFSHLVSLRLRTFQYFTSPVYITRRTVLQKVRDRSHMELSQLADTGFQVLFHSPPGVLFTFPSRYYALSVTKEYLALRGGPRAFRQGFTCLVLLWILSRSLGFVYTAFTFFGRSFQNLSTHLDHRLYSPNPREQAPWFGLFQFRSPLLSESLLFSLPPAT